MDKTADAVEERMQIHARAAGGTPGKAVLRGGEKVGRESGGQPRGNL